MTISEETKKGMDTTVEIIIRNCRQRYPYPLSKALAYEQLEGAIRCLVCVNHIDRIGEAPYEFPSISMEEKYQAMIEKEITP